MPRKYSDKTLKILFATCGHFCAYPDCDRPIVEFRDEGSPEVIGEIAHIYGASNIGPRANPTMIEEERNSYSNLIILCPHHHAIIDKRPDKFPAEDLLKWKRDAENATASRLSLGATKVSFAELKLVCDAFSDGDIALESTPMQSLPTIQKMKRNGLTNAINANMTIGLAIAPQVAQFIREQAKLSSRYPERLRAGFVAQYDLLQRKGLTGDELFTNLIEFGTLSAISTQADINRIMTIRAAATGVLCHLFAICDIFEGANDLSE